jgi:excisionase family DNA binding protein
MRNDEFLFLDEVMRLTRAESISTVRHWLRTGKLASVRPGRRRLVRRSDLEQFLRRGAAPSWDPASPNPRRCDLPISPLGRDGAAPSGSELPLTERTEGSRLAAEAPSSRTKAAQ